MGQLIGAIVGLLLIVGGAAMALTKVGMGGFLIILAGLMILPRVYPRVVALVGGKGWLVWSLSILLALVVGPLTTGQDREKPSLADKYLAQAQDQASRQQSVCSDTMAFAMSQGFVKEALKSPSTATFPSISDDGVAVSETGPCAFSVVAYVDAQNGFGAAVRRDYSAILKYDVGSEAWELVTLAMP